MFIDVTYEGEGAVLALVDEDDLQRFSVRATGCTSQSLSQVLQAHGAGQMVGDEALIDVDWLRRRTAGRPVEWQERFADMLRYAESRGWLNESGTVVTAHVETW